MLAIKNINAKYHDASLHIRTWIVLVENSCLSFLVVDFVCIMILSQDARTHCGMIHHSLYVFGFPQVQRLELFMQKEAGDTDLLTFGCMLCLRGANLGLVTSLVTTWRRALTESRAA